LDGAGILPAPLQRESIGSTHDEGSGRLQPFFISYDSLAADDYFQLAETSPEETRELYETPLFFKAIAVQVDEDVVQRLRDSELARLEDDVNRLNEALARQRGTTT